MPVSEELKEVNALEWAGLVHKIMDQSIYETVILDLDEAIPEVYRLLEICTEIHMPMIQEIYADAKIRQFEREIGLLGKEEILRKIIRKEGHV